MAQATVKATQQATVKATHMRPSDIEWELFHDPHGRPTTPVRMLKTDGPSFLETKFEPNFEIGHHWHPFDTLYFIMDGNITIGPEGNFVPGDIRWIKAGHVYGPEVAGANGVRFFLMALGDEIGLNWSDLYDPPENLKTRLEDFPDRWGRANVEDAMPIDLTTESTIRTISADNPYITRVQVAPGGSLPAYHHSVGAHYFLRAGSMDIYGEKHYTAEDSRWVPAGVDTPGIVAGTDGADMIIVGDGALADFEWE